MEVSNPGDISEIIRTEESLEIDEEEPVQSLHNAVLGFREVLDWSKNLRIENKREELARYRDALEEDSEYEPEFEFSSPSWNLEAARSAAEDLVEGSMKVGGRDLANYGFEEMSPSDVRDLFRGSVQELLHCGSAARHLAEFEEWRDSCLRKWPMDMESYRSSRRILEERDFGERAEKNLDASEVREIFREELESLGIDYRVEVREVTGCHNLPEQQTLVVAAGSEVERLYSESEAEMLAKHEVFHVVRTLNGRRAPRAGFPPILGIHTPFYDAAEEGGGVLREYETGVITGWKEREYHLRKVASGMVKEGEEFMPAAKQLMALGADPVRAFTLLSKNREVLRHHIYLGGMEQWKNTGAEKLLMGKVNSSWAEKLWSEVESGGAFGRPEIGPVEVFSG